MKDLKKGFVFCVWLALACCGKKAPPTPLLPQGNTGRVETEVQKRQKANASPSPSPTATVLPSPVATP